MLKYILILFSLLAASSINAATTSWGEITQLRVGTDASGPRLNIYITSDVPNPALCGVTTHAQVDETRTNAELIQSIALAAFMGGKEVSLDIHDTVCALGGRPLIKAIYIR